MELVTRVGDVPKRGTGNLVAIGKWDGVHLAHQAIIKELVAEAQRTGGQSVVIGFHPLPMAVIRPELAPPVLQTLQERAEALAALGVDVHLALPFNRELAAMEPEEFVQQVLLDQLAVRQVMVGFNNTFGRGGKGTVQTLTRLLSPLGRPVRVFPPVRVDGENVSSTEVRFFVTAGEMERAACLLGRPFSVEGRVVEGDKRGRQMGYPTANLQLAPGRQLPATGVYAVHVTILEQPGLQPEDLPCSVVPRTGSTFGGMLNLGMRPTFQGQELRCEVHLLDYAGDLYGRELRVAFLGRLRGERRFQGVADLREQLTKDEAETRAYLKQHG